MIRLNKFLLFSLLLLVGIASVGFVFSDSGSGNINAGDDSPNEEFTYSNEDNRIDSDDEDSDDPLDEAYYGDDKNSDSSFSINLSEHATSNPIFILIVVLIGLVLGIRKQI